MDREVVTLEVAPLRAQVPGLYFAACSWAQDDGAPDPQELFARAVEALARFYFGPASPDRLLLGETQLAWMANRDAARVIALSRKLRARREAARQRYRSLWDEWARSQSAPLTT